jgi:hypothetical protein
MQNRLNRQQRNILGEKFIELGNLAAVALVFSQLLNAKIIPVAMAVGVIASMGFTKLGVSIMKGGSNELK